MYGLSCHNLHYTSTKRYKDWFFNIKKPRQNFGDKKIIFFFVVNFLPRKITIIQIALFFLIEEVSLTSYANKVKHMIGPNVQFYAILIEHLKVMTTLKNDITTPCAYNYTFVDKHNSHSVAHVTMWPQVIVNIIDNPYQVLHSQETTNDILE